MFAPTQDRRAPGEGFTHEVGDIVTVETPLLGASSIASTAPTRVAPWTVRRRGAHAQSRCSRAARLGRRAVSN
jgi:fumarylacetoacetate (FAA) hydrolase family protein